MRWLLRLIVVLLLMKEGITNDARVGDQCGRALMLRMRRLFA